jgi:acyl-CoA synthetase (AMP-forming)/AMP-acid ligase II
MSTHFQRVLSDSLIFSTNKSPLKPALIVEGVPYTYEQVLQSAYKVAGYLQKKGIQRGDRVAIYMDNTFPCVVSIFGTMLAGGVFMVVNPQTKQDKLEYILNDSMAFALITDGHLTNVFSEACKNAKSVGVVICSGKQPETFPIPLEPFENILNGNFEYHHPTMISLDLAALIYTSGSTGDPKGVMMTHDAMVFAAGSLIQYLRLSEDDRILNVLPLAFDYGLYQLLMSMRLGATLVLERSFTYPAQILNRIQKEKVTVFPGVPTVYMTLIGIHSRSKIRLDSITRITNTAASLPSEIVPQLKEIFPNALIYRMYGLTECKRVCYLEPELIDIKPESVGKAIPGTEVFLLDEEGNPSKPGETGVLHVRGQHVMLGYWNKPKITAQMIKPGRHPGERVLCTQDFFTMDGEGFLYFKGRSDDIIKTRGEKVSPVEVENCLFGIPGISEAAVIGVQDELLGEAVKAFIALDDGCTLTEKEIKAICLSKLENFMVPKSIVFLPELPKTTTGKIQKKALKTI